MDFYRRRSRDIDRGRKNVFSHADSAARSRERLILEGRDDLPEAFLDLLWKGKIQLIVQESLMLTRTEVVRLAAERNSFLNASELYEETAGGQVAWIFFCA